MAPRRPRSGGIPLLLVLALALASVPLPAGGKAAQRPARDAATAKGGAGSSRPATPAPSRPAGPALQKARAELAAVKKSPAKRRYRHNWEKAIHALERAARGPDTGPALLDAARARYALYRFSAVEADRDAALRLASRAAKAGAPQGASLAAAIRREAGDDAPAVAKAQPKRPAPAAPAVAAPSRRPESARPAPAAPEGPQAEPRPAAQPPAVPAPDEEGDLDPALAEAIGDEEPAPPGEPAPSAPKAGPARVSELQAWTNADYTRVAVYLSEPVGFEKQELPADRDHPRRLALDLRPAVLSGPEPMRNVGDGLLHRVRAAQHGPDTVRVVLDLKGQDAYQVFTLGDPPRLIVDLGVREAEREVIARAVPRQAPADEEAESSRRPVRRIIVDAGHGGHDTGAIGPRGVREKDVTLAMARRLAEKLRSLGYEVTLTRTDDRYLKLEERTAIANLARGDLFISVHANAHPRRDRSGVETYFLNVTDDRYARRLAARENGAMEPEEGPAVQRILSDLDAKASAGASRTLARLVQKEITGRARQSHDPVRDLGVKSALFYVLLGARMPAVLVETAFISNRAEEKRLASPAYQQLVADGVARAVVEYAGQVRVAAAR
ncbi:MAG TPA: N-acetylmuramoyl-L-alanine amidase [Anaeromyxobacteraceae bacterium]|nr:N-acetylmuramoyl-L-alanine amidase [Anaeromyxobacteraceae bacterium]